MTFSRWTLTYGLLAPLACGQSSSPSAAGGGGQAGVSSQATAALSSVGDATSASGTATTGEGMGNSSASEGFGGAMVTGMGGSTSSPGNSVSMTSGLAAGSTQSEGASMGGASSSSSTGAAGGAGTAGASGFPEDPQPIVLTDDGGWCWFESPRAVFHDQFLVVGSVASGHDDAGRRGDIEAIVYDLSSGGTDVVERHDRLELDDHDSPAFATRPDGRLVTAYAKHGPEAHFYYRISTGESPLEWGPIQSFAPTAATRLTYSNLFLLTGENNRIYDFYRGLDDSYKPSYAYSDDLGASWTSGNIVIDVPSTQRHRPYVNYASTGLDTIHLVYTEAHPRDFDNSLYHVFYRDGSLHRSNGTVIASLSQGLDSPDAGTRIFQGNAENVAWVTNVVLDAEERPVVGYSVQVGSQGLPTGQGGDDIRYRYARWDGSAWQDYPLAYAGNRLYAGEDDYSGLLAIDPENASVVFFSTNADPVTGEPLISAADGQRHYELFRAETTNGGSTFTISAVTEDSSEDNLRPILPARGPDGVRVLLWLRGSYSSYTDYAQAVVAVVYRD